MQNSDDFNKNRIIVDTYAWIEYFRGSSEGSIAKKFIDGNYDLFTPSIVIGELSDKYRREGIKEWEIRKRLIAIKTNILVLDDNIADRAGEIKQERRKIHKNIGLADSIIIAHSFDAKCFILTGDTHLKSLKNSIDISTKKS